MPLKLYRWNTRAVSGANPGRLQFIDEDDWPGYINTGHLREWPEDQVPPRQLLRLWLEAGGTAEEFEARQVAEPDESDAELIGEVGEMLSAEHDPGSDDHFDEMGGLVE